MSKLSRIRHLVENRGYTIPSGHLGDFGIIVVLTGVQNGKPHSETISINRSDAEFGKVISFVLKKVIPSR